MGRIAAAQLPKTSSCRERYVRWEEVKVSKEKGRKEVHYYLTTTKGRLDLAVIGKEKSLRHMSYSIPNKNLSFLFPLTTPFFKLRSRRDVLHWLNSIVSVSDLNSCELSHFVASSENGRLPLLEIDSSKDNQLNKLGHFTNEFVWLGSAWMCKKRRKHYQSFQKNHVKISVHDFVYVLAGEDKRLIAYLEDMYEDSKGHKMVVVRWFHKIDEVGFNLPHNFNDREILFSLCLQDLNVECIDGLATVLSPQHFNKFLNETIHSKLDPFVCHKLFEEDDVKPFDITRLEGYWKQEIIRYMYSPSPSPSKDQENFQQPVNDLSMAGKADVTAGLRLRKRPFQLGHCDLRAEIKQLTDGASRIKRSSHNSLTNYRSGSQKCPTKDACGDGRKLRHSFQYLKVGSEVEVLSQDSGIRGCWFRASVVKIHKDKVKVRYLDLKDAGNEENQLEEWILASRVAAPDRLGIRISGRTIVRPSPQLNNSKMSCAFGEGMAVDVWWHAGWWEGIVLRKESGDKYLVYFPGEMRKFVFNEVDLRHSQEWLESENAWKRIKEAPDVTAIPSLSPETNHIAVFSEGAQAADCDSCQLENITAAGNDDLLESEIDGGKKFGIIPDLSKDHTLSQLRWSSSKKRKRGSGISKPKFDLNSDGSKFEINRSDIRERFLFPLALNVDHDVCKYVGDFPFSSTVVQPLASVVV